MKPKLNETNVVHLYSLAFTFGIPKLLKELDHFIIDEGKILMAENCGTFLLEALRVVTFSSFLSYCRSIVQKQSLRR